MKKLIAAILVLIVAVMLLTVALAETAAPVVTVDLTRVLLTVMWLAFDALLAWLAKEIVPPVREWFRAHTSLKTQERVWNLIYWLVEAAEQTIIGPLRGPERLQYVSDELRKRGIAIDRALIEAAVKEMKDQGVQVLGELDELEPVKAAQFGIPDSMVDDGK